jgi:hypothetical protein
LFQIFALSLVSAGVYLLSRSRGNLRRAESTTRRIAKIGDKIGPLVANAPFSSALGNHFVVALQESRHLKSARTKTRRALLIAGVRESLSQLSRQLERGRHDSMGIERSQHDIFLDQACEIERNLAGIPGVEELLKVCGECKRILKEGDFAKRYERQLRGISDPA